jgi:hypothetical protein
MLFSFFIQSPHNRQIKDAEILLKVFRKHIDSSYYHFAATNQENKVFWSYYLLKENFKKPAFWTKEGQDMSANEKAIDTMIEYYLQCNNEIDYRLDEKENEVLEKLIAGFYERLQIISPVDSATPNESFFVVGKFKMVNGHSLLGAGMSKTTITEVNPNM